MRAKDTEFSSHIRGVEDFPPDYQERLRWGGKDDRESVNREIIDALPVHNIGAFVELLAEMYGDRVAIREPFGEGDRNERTLTYNQLLTSVRSRALHLLRLGVQHGERVGLVSENNIDALILKFACEYIGATPLPWTERIEDAGMTTAEAMERAHVPWLALHMERSIRHIWEAGRSDFPHIDMLRSTKHIFGVTENDQEQIVRMMGTSPLRDVEESELSDRMERIRPSDTAIIFYSPGSGGLSSKMVEVSHANMLYQYCVTPGVLKAPPGVRYLHMLPPYHVFGETMLGMVLSLGGEVDLTDLRRLTKGGLSLLQRGKFELFATIPDFWRYLRTTIEQKLPGFVRSTLVEDMVRVAWADTMRAQATGNASLIEETDRYWKPLLEEHSKHIPEGSVLTGIKRGIRATIAHLLYPTIRRRAGIGSLQWGISGGAKLLAEEYAFFSALKGSPDRPGIKLHSGYGLTEAGVASISNFGGDTFAATVGHIIPGTVAWTEKTPEGFQEVCIAGSGVAHYRDMGLQQELIPDGVLRTGDQGKVIEIQDHVSGDIRQLIIYERQLKRMIKWKGASMLPAPMEALLKDSPFIDDALVVGDGQDRLGVLIFPNTKAIEEYCCTHRIEGFDQSKSNWDHPGIRTFFQKEVDSRMRMQVTKQRARVDSFRVIREVPQEVRMASGVLHPRKTEEYFAMEISDLWKKKEFAIQK